MPSLTSESSIHGVNFIFNSNYSKYSRFFWSFSLFCSFLGFIYYIHIAFAKYHTNPDVVQKVSQRPLFEIPFPSVTVCSPAFGRRSIVEFRDINENFYFISNPFLPREMAEITMANTHWCQMPYFQGMNFFFGTYGVNDSKNVINLIEKSSLDVDEVIKKNFYRKFGEGSDSTSSSLIQFDKVLTDRGFCYTTNLQNHDLIFKEEISKDFDSYKRKIVKGVDMSLIESKVEKIHWYNDSVHWTLSGGYPTGKFI